MDRWRTIDSEALKPALQQIAAATGGGAAIFLCIGTDRSTGDALGPLVGTALAEAGFERVIGTLASPCDANTLPLRLGELAAAGRGGGPVIAIDAALGRPESIGKFQITAAPVLPGASLGRKLPPAGDYGIAGIVNSAKGGKHPYAILQNTSLYRVLTMSRQLAEAIAAVFPK